MTEETIFTAALEKKDPADRAAFLDGACAGDAAFRQRVEALLKSHEEAAGFLERPVADLPSPPPPGHGPDLSSPPPRGRGTGGEGDPAQGPTTDYRPLAGEGAVIGGRYTLVEKIGEGGMGEVWVAKQDEPVKRKVALKLIRADKDSRAVLARFEQERQALAVMDHPNIAKVLDAGTAGISDQESVIRQKDDSASGPITDHRSLLTGSGRPFFVMELVHGMPLTRFCDEAKLSLKDRLELFVPICQAVQHAHQKGIVHRDLKPSNILVTLYDGRPVPKVIDFGVAKATGGKLTEETLSTQFGAVVGTLEYMAPEQAGISAHDVDTRADIYSLGVLLYELLTGLRPFDSKRLKQAAIDEAIRILREEEPPKPSTRLSSDASSPSLAAVRQTEPKKLAALLRGELDWVVMKCLERERGRRYETANGLARDIQRYLADEPVEARPPSAGYKLRKFLRRNKGPVLAASLVLLVLVAGIVSTTWGMVREAEQRRLAEANEKKANEEKERAEKAAAAEKAARQTEERERKYAEAIADFVKEDFFALTSVEGQHRFGDPQKDRLDKDATLKQLLDRAAARLNQRHDLDPRVEADLRWMIGVNYRGMGEYRQAIPFLQRCVALRREALGLDHEATLYAQNSLAVAFGVNGQFDKALPLLEETLKLMTAKLGTDHPDTLMGMNNLAKGYQAAGKLDRALPLLEDNLRLVKAKLGADHSSTLTSMNNLALGYQAAGKLDRALPLLEQTLELTKAKLGADHPSTLTSMNNLAAAYWQAKQLEKSIPLFEETLQAHRKKLGDNHPHTLRTLANLGVNYRDAGRLAEATALLEQAHRESRRHASLQWVGEALFIAYVRAGMSAEGSAHVKENVAAARATLPANTPQLAGALAINGSSFLQLRAWSDAEPLLRECLAIREKKEPDAWTTFNTKSMLGEALGGQKQYAAAEPLLVQGYEGMRERQAKMPPQAKDLRLREALERLVQLYDAWGKKDKAAEWRKKLEKAKQSKPASKSP